MEQIYEDKSSVCKEEHCIKSGILKDDGGTAFVHLATGMGKVPRWVPDISAWTAIRVMECVLADDV